MHHVRETNFYSVQELNKNSFRSSNKQGTCYNVSEIKINISIRKENLISMT